MNLCYLFHLLSTSLSYERWSSCYFPLHSRGFITSPLLLNFCNYSYVLNNFVQCLFDISHFFNIWLFANFCSSVYFCIAFFHFLAINLANAFLFSLIVFLMPLFCGSTLSCLGKCLIILIHLFLFPCWWIEIHVSISYCSLEFWSLEVLGVLDHQITRVKASPILIVTFFCV